MDTRGIFQFSVSTVVNAEENTTGLWLQCPRGAFKKVCTLHIVWNNYARMQSSTLSCKDKNQSGLSRWADILYVTHSNTNIRIHTQTLQDRELGRLSGEWQLKTLSAVKTVREDKHTHQYNCGWNAHNHGKLHKCMCQHERLHTNCRHRYS